MNAHLLVFILNLGRSQELHRFAFEKHLGARGQFLGDWRRVRAERYHGDGRMCGSKIWARAYVGVNSGVWEEERGSRPLRGAWWPLINGEEVEAGGECRRGGDGARRGSGA